MAIHTPGQRFRYHNILKRRGGKRTVTALLSLTAMVDMFTVLVIFLLQSYNTTGKVIFLPNEVTLPEAQTIKPLNPAIVVIITNKEIFIDKTPVMTYDEAKGQEDWMLRPLYDSLLIALQKSQKEFESKLKTKIDNVIGQPKNPEEEVIDPKAWKHVTILADKGMDFATVRKVMFTLTEAGAGKVNFAVLKMGNETP
ncbi:MAG: biopolymer transporter ExbD [Bdellovibrionota bacterium]